MPRWSSALSGPKIFQRRYEGVTYCRRFVAYQGVAALLVVTLHKHNTKPHYPHPLLRETLYIKGKYQLELHKEYFNQT
jgi:hypothetical protein